MTKKMRMSVKVLGVALGTASGWDTVDDWHVVFYDFEPSYGIDLRKGDLNVDYVNGLFQGFDDEGRLVWKHSMISFFKEEYNL